MAANDDFPRGFSIHATTSAALPSITVPALIGVSHVLTMASMELLVGAAGAFQAILAVYDGATLIASAYLGGEGAAGFVAIGEVDIPGPIAITPGNLLQVTATLPSGALAVCDFNLLAQGYDI